jgi:hypothetical protein
MSAPLIIPRNKAIDLPSDTETYDIRVSLIEHMFNSKQWDVPVELKNSSILELNSFFVSVLLKLTDKDPQRLHYGSEEMDEFQNLAIHIKKQLVFSQLR